MQQLHKKFIDSQIKELFEKYLANNIPRIYIQNILGIKERRFFHLLKKYKTDPQKFSIQYLRKSVTRKISQHIEKNINIELIDEQKLINDPDIPINFYNYSFIQKTLKEKYNQIVSVPTIIDRAKKQGFYINKPKKKYHDHEVLTNYIGQLIQHDSSHHKFSSYANEKWYLITSLDDFSRFILYAVLILKETSVAHISALESVLTEYGFPTSYYVDSHSIFRFVQGRDSLYRTHYLLTDDADTQFKQVLDDCNVKLIYALSAQAKGKIERPYSWIQEYLVRICSKEHISDLSTAQDVLKNLISQYNHKWVHSTTKEIPFIRFQNAKINNLSLFREFKIKPPFISPKDIFCHRINRVTDPYRKISLNNLKFSIKDTNPHDTVNLRIYPLDSLFSEIRFWSNNKLVDVQNIKNSDLQGLQY